VAERLCLSVSSHGKQKNFEKWSSIVEQQKLQLDETLRWVNISSVHLCALCETGHLHKNSYMCLETWMVKKLEFTNDSFLPDSGSSLLIY
jgi:hypothetical protein